jgi:hypothetical protein
MTEQQITKPKRVYKKAAKVIEEPKPIRLGSLKNAAFQAPFEVNNPWNPWMISTDTMELNEEDDFKEQVEACRFFYKKDPIIGTAINKMVEIGINELKFYKNGMTDNEFRVFLAIKEKLQEFAEIMALEYLTSGLVIPEVSYNTVSKETLNDYGIKKYVGGLTLPTSLSLRDPSTIKINQPLLGNQPSYFIKVPDTLFYFIQNKGVYKDGTKDPDLYKQLVSDFPEFVKVVNSGKKDILLDNDLIFRGKYLSDSPYPIPFVSNAIESLKHKRNLRRMDYSIASRAIGAIQLFNLGSDLFPITEENADDFQFIKDQMHYRNGRRELDLERIFQLFANHTLKVSWVYPPLDALLNEAKYNEVNSDIIFGLGFPRVLITGETQKSGTSSAEIAMMGPIKSMDFFRRKIITVLRAVVRKVADLNNFKTEPTIRFKPLNLFDYNILLTALKDLYGTGNLSRTEYSEELGFDWNDSQGLREEENKVLKAKNLEDINAKPFSNPGQVPGTDTQTTGNPVTNPKPTTTAKPTTKTKPTEPPVTKPEPNPK